MKDYDLKKRCIEEQKDVLLRELNYNLWVLKDHFDKPSLEEWHTYWNLIETKFTKEEYRVCTNLNHNRRRRRNLLRDRIELMLQCGTCYFITLTFNDDYINLKNSTMREYVKRLFNSLDVIYVANIDYGELHERVHYHAVVCSDEKPDLSGWNCGFTNAKEITYGNSQRLGDYINKLTNHAIKHSTMNNYVIYSKKFKELKI